MSSSKIIKLHSVCPQVVVVGDRRYAGGMEDADGGPLAARSANSLAELIVERAREEAAAIVGKAVAEAGNVHQAAFAEGMEQGLAAAREETAELIARLQSVVEATRVENREYLRGAEQQVLKLALDIARKAIEMQIAVDPSVVVAPIVTAVTNIESNSVTRVRLNAADRELVAAHWQVEKGVGDGRCPELVADARVPQGGCIVETKTGVVDAQLETKLQEIEKALYLAGGFRNR